MSASGRLNLILGLTMISAAFVLFNFLQIDCFWFCIIQMKILHFSMKEVILQYFLIPMSVLSRLQHSTLSCHYLFTYQFRLCNINDNCHTIFRLFAQFIRPNRIPRAAKILYLICVISESIQLAKHFNRDNRIYWSLTGLSEQRWYK